MSVIRQKERIPDADSRARRITAARPPLVAARGPLIFTRSESYLRDADNAGEYEARE